jgi:hypothetical protein
MNLKKILGVVLVFGFVTIAAYAQELPMRGMYVTNDSNAQYKYITLGDSDVRLREIQFMSADGHRVLQRYTMQYSSSSSVYSGQTGQATFRLTNLSRESFTIQIGMGSRITYTRM